MHLLCYVSRIKNNDGVIFSKLPTFVGKIHHMLNFNGANLNTGLYTVRYLSTKYKPLQQKKHNKRTSISAAVFDPASIEVFRIYASDGADTGDGS
jgi:hypothetical protein